MQRDTTKRYYTLHGWMGAATGTLMFVIALTGALSVFGRPELKIWANEEIRGGVEVPPADIQNLLDEHVASLDPAWLHEVRVNLPGLRSFPELGFVFERHDASSAPVIRLVNHEARTLEITSEREGSIQEVFAAREGDVADFIVNFHADLHLGRPIGLLLTGLLGLTLLVSIITGIVTHRKILREAFTFRPFRSLRLLLTDSHKALGVWGLMFNAAIAFTGAFLGLATVVLVPAAAYVSFGGDQEALVETFTARPEVVLTDRVERTRVAEIIAEASARPGYEAYNVTIHGYGDAAARVYVDGAAKSAETGMGGLTLVYEGATGTLVNSYQTFGRLGGVTGPVLDVMFPLHFGNFGGVLIKAIWTGLGLGTALLALTGTLIWLDRRRYGAAGTMTQKSYHRISRFTAGTSVGLCIALALLFHVQLLAPALGRSADPLFGPVFFGSWAIIALLGMGIPAVYRTTRLGLAVTGVILALVPAVNAAVTGDALWLTLFNGKTVTAAVDACLLLLGVSLIWMALRMPNQRPADDTARRERRLAQKTLRDAPATAQS